MTRPGVVVTSRADLPPRSAPTDAGMGFLVGATATGTAVKTVGSMTQYTNEFGDRTGGQPAYDAAETFFREGGSKLTVSPAAIVAPATGIDAASIDNALDALTRDMGPGQVFVADPLGTDAATHASLIAHAGANNRIALLDAPADSDATDLEALAGTYVGDVNARYAALFAPPAIVPGVTSGTTRTVPYSALEAGIISRNDAAYNPNVPAAGDLGVSRFALDLGARFTDAERESLNAAGVDIARVMWGQVKTYGYRTLAPDDTGWLGLGNARLNMEIVAKAEAIGEHYVFAQIDGRRVKISQFGAELTGMLVPYEEAGALYRLDDTAGFFVDVGPAVNTDALLATGELHAVIGLRMSPFAEYVVIEIVKVAADQTLAVAA
jgi:phage tail sheath protein FI